MPRLDFYAEQKLFVKIKLGEASIQPDDAPPARIDEERTQLL